MDGWLNPQSSLQALLDSLSYVIMGTLLFLIILLRSVLQPLLHVNGL